MVKCLKQFFIVIGFVFFMTTTALADPIFQTNDGQTVQLSKLKGKWLVLNYWASWCDACREEIPELNAFYQYALHSNILFFSVSYDPLNLTELHNIPKKLGILFPVLTESPDEAWGLGSIDVIPVTFIFNPKGTLVKTLYGSNTKESLTTLLSDLSHDTKK